MDQSLESDSQKRLDLVSLKEGRVEEAQANKEKMEVIQRQDRTLREAATKRRAKGGAKFVYENPNWLGAVAKSNDY